MNPTEISALAARSGLDHIWRKVEAAERLTSDDATRLLSSDDLLALGAMADFARKRIAGDEVFFISNRHINHTNVCRNRCLFCAFSHDEGDADAYTLSIDEVVDKARETLAVGGISEIHIVGGEHPDLPFSYYLDMMRALRELAPDVHIQAFTASGSLGRWGSTLPGMAASASRSSRTRAVRMLVSCRQTQRSQPTGPSRGPAARTRRDAPQSAVRASCSSGVASPSRSAPRPAPLRPEPSEPRSGSRSVLKAAPRTPRSSRASRW